MDFLAEEQTERQSWGTVGNGWFDGAQTQHKHCWARIGRRRCRAHSWRREGKLVEGEERRQRHTECCTQRDLQKYTIARREEEGRHYFAARAIIPLAAFRLRSWSLPLAALVFSVPFSALTLANVRRSILKKGGPSKCWREGQILSKGNNLLPCLLFYGHTHRLRMWKFVVFANRKWQLLCIFKTLNIFWKYVYWKDSANSNQKLVHIVF